MSRTCLSSCCFAAALILPLVSSAQSMDYGAAAAWIDSQRNAALVSVHELQIPEKARNAFEKGIERFAAKDAAGSVSEFQKAIKVFPAYYEAYDKMGDAELLLNSWEPAETAYKKAIELSRGRYAPPHFGLGLILCNQEKRPGEAEETVREGLAMSPTDPGGDFVLSWVLYSMKRMQDAEKSARDAILQAPMFAGARLLLAQIHLRENNLSAVVQDLDSYLGLGIDSSFNAKIRAIRADALRGLSGDNVESGPERPRRPE